MYSVQYHITLSTSYALKIRFQTTGGPEPKFFGGLTLVISID